MILGMLLLLATGLSWAFTGALLSYCARRRIAVGGEWGQSAVSR